MYAPCDDPAVAAPTAIPCLPTVVIFDDFESNSFTTTLSAFTLISNTARGGDYVVATVSSQPLVDRNGGPLNTNQLYLGNSRLQSLVVLADSLRERGLGTVQILYGRYDYRVGPDPPGLIELIFGIELSWTPGAFDFGDVGDGLLVYLSARLQVSNGTCGLVIRGKTQQSFGGDLTDFRAGPQFTQQKLDALATAYYRARIWKKGFNTLEINNGILTRMQWQ